MASVKLAEFCCTGGHIKEIIVALCRAGGDKEEYMRWTMSDAIVSSVNFSGGGGGSLPMEEVTFSYGVIKWVYSQTDHKTGKAKGKVPFGWNLHENKKA